MWTFVLCSILKAGRPALQDRPRAQLPAGRVLRRQRAHALQDVRHPPDRERARRGAQVLADPAAAEPGRGPGAALGHHGHLRHDRAAPPQGQALLPGQEVPHRARRGRLDWVPEGGGRQSKLFSESRH